MMLYMLSPAQRAVETSLCNPFMFPCPTATRNHLWASRCEVRDSKEQAIFKLKSWLVLFCDAAHQLAVQLSAIDKMLKSTPHIDCDLQFCFPFVSQCKFLEVLCTIFMVHQIYISTLYVFITEQAMANLRGLCKTMWLSKCLLTHYRRTHHH